MLAGADLVAASAAVALALAAHAFAEGLATGALLGRQPRRQVAAWVALMCLSPVAGAAAAGAWPVPDAAEPVLLAMAAGVLAQAARVSLRAAFHGQRPARVLLSLPPPRPPPWPPSSPPWPYTRSAERPAPGRRGRDRERGQGTRPVLKFCCGTGEPGAVTVMSA